MWQHFKSFVVRKLGGFPTVDDAIAEIQGKDREERTKILTLAVRRLYNTIGAEDILRESGQGGWLFEGKQIPKHVMQLVSAEAKQLLESKLWEVLQRDVAYQANRKMFLLGKSETDLVAGKLWLYSFDAMRTRLTSLAKGSGSFNSTDKG